MHSSLNFTFKKEENDSPSFLDVLEEKSNEGILTSVFRKPTFAMKCFLQPLHICWILLFSLLQLSDS